MITRPRAVAVAVISALIYTGLLALNITVALPTWLAALSTVMAVVCIFMMVTCCVVIFEQDHSSYEREFGNER